MAETIVEIGPFSTALGQWAMQRGLRGKDIADTVAKAMGYLVKNALRRIDKGDRAKIERSLLTIIQEERQGAAKRKRAKGVQAEKFRGTLAARLVYLLDYKGARAQFRARSPKFYQTVGQWYRARLFSTNLHRAGLLPALSTLRQGTEGPMPRYRKAPGDIKHAFTAEDAEIVVRNWASSAERLGRQPAGITGLAGDAFEAGLSEMERRVAEFLQRDMEAAAARAGLR